MTDPGTSPWSKPGAPQPGSGAPPPGPAPQPGWTGAPQSGPTPQPGWPGAAQPGAPQPAAQPWPQPGPPGAPQPGPPGAPQPAPPGAPQPAPPGGPQTAWTGAAGPPPSSTSKKSGLGFFGILGLLAVIGACVFFAFQFFENRRFEEGACLDYYPAGIFDYNPDANVVDCDSPDARSKIIAVHDSGEGECPARASATLTRGDTVFCLARA